MKQLPQPSDAPPAAASAVFLERRSAMQITIKHVLEFVLALFLLIATSPLLFAIMLLIKIDDGGPIFFRQERLGKDGKPFLIWKFRTMFVDADKLLAADGSVQANRVTRVGRRLRFFSLDELPQLINVLTGDMSLIGPRPVLTSYLERYTPVQRGRLAMRPGITGLAQIHGRNTLPWSKRIDYDLCYIQHYSLLLDLKILLKTIGVVITRDGIVLDRNSAQVDNLPRQERY